jgi:hypothetical protein
VSTSQVLSGRKLFHDEIYIVSGGHVLKIEARLKATLFLAGIGDL